MADTLFTGAPLRIRAAGRAISGYMVRYADTGLTTEGLEKIVQGAFEPLTGPYQLTMRHDQEAVITNNLQIRAVAAGIEISSTLPDTDLGNAALRDITAGKLTGFSAEFYDREIEMAGDTRLVKRGRLIGAGLVDVPAFAGSALQLRHGGRRRVNAWLL